MEENIFKKDEEVCFYLHETEKGGFRSPGLFCARSVQDYRNDHENTVENWEKLFVDYLQTVGFNAEPVLMTYTDDPMVKNILEEKVQQSPEYDFTITDRVGHRLWKISDNETLERLVNILKKMKWLYIADAHHRSVSSNLLSSQMTNSNKSLSGTEAYNFFMVDLILESEIRIYGFNRLVKDLNGHSKEEFLIQLDEHFRIEKKEDELYEPTNKHHFSTYLGGEFFSLYLRRTNYTFTDALSRLDTHILHKTVLNPILPIEDLRNDKRIPYGKHNLIKMKDSIDKGDFMVGFSLAPITIAEIKAIANVGLTMSPKSTYIGPKLRSGLTICEL